MSQDRPAMIVVAGPNGSGKTSLTSQLLLHEWLRNCIYINPDEIAQNQFGDWNSPEAVIKAAQLAQTMREECLTKRANFVFETVLSSANKLDFLRNGVEAGYFIRLFFVATSSPAINASRVAHRVMQGGHDVPISKIISRYAKSIANCATCASFVDRAYIYDNSEDGKIPRLLFRTQDGKTVKVYGEMPEWGNKIKNEIDSLKSSQERPGPGMSR
jgi:predicted ABC-type ATPase